MMDGQDKIHLAMADIARRYGVSDSAVDHLMGALMAGYLSQAQFNHPELGGMGQWSQGGMVMIGDMFNNGLKGKVDQLCNELADLARREGGPRPSGGQHQSQFQGNGSSASFSRDFADGSGNWWPDGLGNPAATGAQNDMRYAFFPSERRLALSRGGKVTLYDTGDHAIGGFSQQQGGDQSIGFTSQYGSISLLQLPQISTGDGTNSSFAETARETPGQAPALSTREPPPREPPPHVPPPPAQRHSGEAPSASAGNDDIFDKIERLAALHAKGILSDNEYEAKKADLLARL